MANCPNISRNGPRASSAILSSPHGSGVTEKQFTHDLISSDRRDPTVNAYGPLYGSPEYSSDDIPILDPKTHKVTFFKMSVADPNAPESFGPPFHGTAMPKPTAPSAYWGDEKIWSQRANNHNGMFDKQGRVWFAAAVRGTDNPAFCKKGSEHPSAKTFPLESRAAKYRCSIRSR